MRRESTAALGRWRAMRKQARALIGGTLLLASLHGCTRRQTQLEPPPARTASDAGAVAVVSDAAAVASSAAIVASSAAVVASSTARDAAADAPEGRCDVMRATGDGTPGGAGSWPHLADRPLEQAIRRFYASQVLARGIDKRSFERHPVVFQRG